MALSEVFSFSFILSLAITCILVGAVSFLFYNKLQQQTAKISAIMDLTTTIVTELNAIKMREGMVKPTTIPLDSNIHSVKMDVPVVNSNLEPLIEVSDDENKNSDSEDDSERESESEYENKGESEDESEDECEDESEDESEGEIDDESDDEEDIEEKDEPDNQSMEELQINSDLGELDIKNLNFEKASGFLETDNSSKVIELNSEALDEITSIPIDDNSVEQDDVVNDSKIINITEPDNTDYTKYTVNELRNIARARGLIGENEKPKKPKLIDLLSA